MASSSEIAYVGIGSNLENPREQVLQAIAELPELQGCTFLVASSLYKSKPMGPSEQPDYINAVACLQTELEPIQLLVGLQAIEQRHGRKRLGEHWGPRTLDLDLLLYGDVQIVSESLVIPHPGMHQRAFVLYPLAQIAPQVNIPGLGSVQDIINSCPLDGLEKLEYR